jgi:hypothetical protein
MKTRRTDEPGAVLYWDGAPEDKPQWEHVPEIPGSLFRVIDTVMQMMRLMASDDQSEAQADLTNVAAKTLQQVLEQSLNRWDGFRSEMAAWDAAIMRHSLLLCARHYSEPRLMKIKGRDGWEHIPDFQGAQLMGEVDVKVFSDSLVPQTRQGVQDQLTWINANFPGWLQPQDALVALQEAALTARERPTGLTLSARTRSSSACVTARTWRCRRAHDEQPDDPAAERRSAGRVRRWGPGLHARRAGQPRCLEEGVRGLDEDRRLRASGSCGAGHGTTGVVGDPGARAAQGQQDAMLQMQLAAGPGDGERCGSADEGDAFAAGVRAAAGPQ